MEISADKLNTEECAHYLLQWECNKKGILEICDSEYKDTKMESTNTSSFQTLKRLRNHKTYKYVGITTSPSGNPKESIIVLQKICNKFAHNIQKALILPKEAQITPYQIFIPKLQYKLPSYCISKRSMMKIQK